MATNEQDLQDRMNGDQDAPLWARRNRAAIGLNREARMRERLAEMEAASGRTQEDSGLIGNVARATGRGVLRAGLQTSNAVLSVGRGILKGTNAYKLLGDDEWDREWLEWYESDVQQANPLNAAIDVGDRAEGFLGFYEGMVEFGTGFIAGGAALRTSSVFRGLGRGAQSFLQGATADLLVFDPQEERLSNLLMEWGPTSWTAPVTQFLAAEEDDSELEGRLKNVLEGGFTGLVVDGIIRGLRTMRVKIKARNGEITHEEGERRVAAILEEARGGRVEEPPVDVERRSGVRQRLADIIDPERAQEIKARFTDQLTGLRNQDAFHRAKPRLEADPGTELVMIDLKNFKALNDNLGMEAGNQKLKDVAEALSGLGIESRSVFRAGGDEFVLAVPTGRGDEFGRAAMEAIGSSKIGDTRFSFSARYGVGQTLSEADAAAAVVKAGENGPKARDLVEVIRNPEAEAAARKQDLFTVTRNEEGGYDVVPTNSLTATRVPEGVPLKQSFEREALAHRTKDSLNMVDRVFRRNRQQGGPITLSESARVAIRVARERIRAGADPRDVEALMEGTNLNLAHLQSTDEVKGLILALSETIQHEFDEVTLKKLEPRTRFSNRSQRVGRSDSAVLRAAERMIPGVKQDALIEQLRFLTGATHVAPETVLGARILMKGLGENVVALSRAVELDPRNGLALKAMLKDMDRLANVAVQLGGAASNIARALRAFGQEVTDESLDRVREGAVRDAQRAPRELKAEAFEERPFSELFQSKNMTAEEAAALARSLSMTNGDPESILRALRLTLDQARIAEKGTKGFWDRVVSFRAAMMLSGPRTHFTNFFSSLATNVQVPIEIMIGGVRSGDREITKYGWDLLTSPAANGFWIVRESLSMARRSWRENTSILDPYFTKTSDVLQPIPGDVPTNWVQKGLAAPSRALVTVDEFMKRMAYLSDVRAKSLAIMRQETEELGSAFSPEQMLDRIKSDMDAAVDEGGEALWAQSLEHARTTTFTNKLERGSFGAALQTMANRWVGFRLIMPFVRTPVNIFQFSLDRAPAAGLWNKRMREALASSDPTIVARAQGQLAFGQMMYSAGAIMAHQGMITGGGPSDPRLREQMIAAGWQPYSFRVPGTDNWVNYRRLEPIATPIAIMADAFEAFGELDGGEAENVAMSLLAGISASVSSKTFLIGLTDFFDAIGSGEPYKARQFVSSFISSFTPAFLRQVKDGVPLVGDEIWRETQGVLGQARASLPGFSNQLEPRRNIFGEPVLKTSRMTYGPLGDMLNTTLNPFTVTDGRGQDEVLMELAKLGRAMPMPAEKLPSGIDLRDARKYPPNDPKKAGQSPYDRWMEIVSELGLREKMVQLVESDVWQTKLSDGGVRDPGSKHFVAAEMVYQIQQAARAQMLSEYDSLLGTMGTRQREGLEALLR